jgi:hypothetical protein
MVPETQVRNLDPVAGITYRCCDVGQAKWKDRIGNLFAVRRHQKDAHTGQCVSGVTTSLPSMPRSRWLFRKGSFLLQ